MKGPARVVLKRATSVGRRDEETDPRPAIRLFLPVFALLCFLFIFLFFFFFLSFPFCLLSLLSGDFSRRLLRGDLRAADRRLARDA